MGCVENTKRRPMPGLFFTLPLEIRRIIYAKLVPGYDNPLLEAEPGIHLMYLQDSGPQLWPCLNPELDHCELGLERLPIVTPHMVHPLWRMRLLSPWGPHWRCDEHYGKRPMVEGSAVLEVCRQMRLEFVEVLAENSRIEITSLADVAILAKPPQPAFSIGSLLVAHITRLSITLNLPFRLFQELQGTAEASDRPLPEGIAAMLPLWRSLPQNILAGLPKLRVLRLWVDHDEPEQWTSQSTLAVVESVRKLAFRGRDSGCTEKADDSNQGVGGESLREVHLFLPRLPHDEHVPIRRPEDVEIVVTEVARQRYRVRQDAHGDPEVYYVNEWPELENHPIHLLSRDQRDALQQLNTLLSS